MKVTGGQLPPAVLAALSQVPEVARQVRRTAAAIRDDARAMAPYRSGALRRSIRVERAYNRRTQTVEFRVGWNPEVAFYGWMVEAGTETQPARPHLRPAAIKHGARPDDDDEDGGGA